MRNKILKATIFAGLVILLGQLATAGTFAYRGDPLKQGPNCTNERHEAVQKAIESKNYNEWKKLMEGKPVVNRISEANFAKFTQIHQLLRDGKTDEANKLRAELGLGNGQGFGKGFGRGLQK